MSIATESIFFNGRALAGGVIQPLLVECLWPVAWRRSGHSFLGFRMILPWKITMLIIHRYQKKLFLWVMDSIAMLNNQIFDVTGHNSWLNIT